MQFSRNRILFISVVTIESYQRDIALCVCGRYEMVCNNIDTDDVHDVQNDLKKPSD